MALPQMTFVDDPHTAVTAGGGFDAVIVVDDTFELGAYPEGAEAGSSNIRTLGRASSSALGSSVAQATSEKGMETSVYSHTCGQRQHPGNTAKAQ